MSFKQQKRPQQKYQQDIDTQRSQSHDEEHEQRVPLQAQQQQSIAQVTESGPSSHGLSSPASVDQKISSSITNGNGTIPTSSSNNGDSASNAIGNSRLTYDPCIQALPLSQRKQARDAALQEAETVLYALQQQRDHPFFYHSNGYNTPHNNGNGRISSMKVGSGFRNKNGNFLDNFNLLGVVTSPTLLLEQNTTTNIGKSSHPRVPTSHDDSMYFGGSSGGESQPRTTSTSTFPTTSATSASASNSFFLDPSFFSSVSAMSTTLSKEIESLNSTLSSYSKTYLGSMSLPSYYFSSDTAAGSLDFETELNSIASQVLLRSTNHSIYPYVFGEDIIKGQIPEDHLPKEIVDLDLSNVEAYLAKCGSLAEQLNLRDVSPLVGETNDENDRLDQKFDKINTVDDNNDNGDENDMEDPTHFVPDIFFSPDFDLTDPNVFSSLLVVSKEREDGDSLGEEGGGGEQDGMEDLGGLIRLQDPFEFTRYLDAVELALLHQVRSKSSSFFRETNRFTELKSLIASSVEEVMALRNDLQKIRERSIADAEMIPIMDKRRKDTKLLKELLDEVEYVVQVKSSIGEMIQNRNYLEAVERIHLARSLLNGDCVATVDGGRRGKYALRKITALSKMHDQLAQYENLVVMDLSSDLVDMFLSWNSRNNDDLFMQTTPSSLSSDCRTSKVKNTILALKKCGKLSTMAEIYKEKLSETIRVTVVTTISECAVDAAKGDVLITSSSATIVAIPEKGMKDDAPINDITKPSIIDGVTSMSFDQFMECLDMIYENILSLLKSAASVNKFCLEEGISFKDDGATDERNNGDISTGRNSTSSHPSALSSGADISHRSISELLRLRKDSHSLISFEEMRRLWDSCLAFTLQVEQLSGQKAYVLRSTLLSQAKAFIERKHEANMSSLAATLDAERWVQCDVSPERQCALDRLCSGRALSSTRDTLKLGLHQTEKQPFAVVEGKRFRVVWSCLLLIETVMSNILCAAHFQALATNVVGKVAELLRLFNSRSTHLVLGAGAIHSSARLKSINAKHLAIVTQCVGVVQSILPHIRAALMSQLPIKQHTLLVDLDKIKKDYVEHHNKVLDKFVSIIGGIVEHSLAPKIAGTDFDQRGKEEKGNQIECCQFLDGVITNTKKMHQVLHSLLPQEDLADVFSRIFAHLDSKVPKMFLSMDSDTNVQFTLPQTLEGKNQIVLELNTMATTLNSLEDVTPWDFGAMNFLARRLEIVQDHGDESPLGQEPSDENQLNITSDSAFQEALDETSSPQTARSTEEIQVVDSSLITSNETEPRNSESGSGHEISEEEHNHGDEKDDSLTASCGEVNDMSMNDDENMINNENEEEDSKTLADT